MNNINRFLNYAVLVMAALTCLIACGKSGQGEAGKVPHGERAQPEVTEKDNSHEGQSAEALSKASGPLCSAHGAPEKDCWICDAKLRDPDRLWCKEHGTYEDRCWKCHPELQDKSRLYCKEHGVYEDECTLCHPELKEKSSRVTQEASALEQAAADAEKAKNKKDENEKGLYCNEHRLLEKECAICHPELLDALRPGQGLRVRLPSSESARKAGLKVEAARQVSGSSKTTAGFLSVVRYNRNKMTHIVPKASGTVGRVLVENGDAVKQGQLLGYFSSPEAARAKSDFLSALADSTLKSAVFRREEELVAQKVSSRRELEMAETQYHQAQAALEAASQRLSDLGLTYSEISDLRQGGKSSSDLMLRAPFAGTIVEREAVSGAAASADTPLFTVVDLAQMWLEMSIPAATALTLREGDGIAAHFPDLGKAKIPGKITWIASEIDEASRMVKVRAEIPNPSGILKRGLYGKADLLPPAPGDREEGGFGQVGVPGGALQRIDGKDYVFVSVQADLYEARLVEVTSRRDNDAIVSEGLRAGEPVVVAGSFTLRSEMFKSSFGAGCAGHH